ncbi:MAG: hypothetical protein DME03_12345 [Candidatus Rokuibacteriota bacterium]|nr:MAG: hypothetical protein DME03_12345 [Candidatus Rokubacteria bacterium]
MIDYRTVERQLSGALGLQRRPVAVAFRSTPPPGVARFSGVEPSGCSFWRLAMSEKTFYTVPADHHNCPIGSYTHNITPPAERAGELGQTLGLMADLGYLRMEEVPGIPRLPTTPGAVVYAPLGDTPVDPDVVLVAGRPGRVMLLQEAALRAGIAAPAPLLGRPTCMALPASLAQGVIATTGCVGNRVYTDLGEDELYVVVPGKDVARVAAEAQTIANANLKLSEYHRGRRQALATQ